MEILNIASATLLGVGKAKATPEPSGTSPSAAAGVTTPESVGAAQKPGQLDAAVANIQSYAQSVSRNLNFSIDDSTGEVVVKVIDGDSGKVVRQIPSEEVLKLAARLDDMRSLMFEAHA